MAQAFFLCLFDDAAHFFHKFFDFLAVIKKKAYLCRDNIYCFTFKPPKNEENSVWNDGSCHDVHFQLL